MHFLTGLLTGTLAAYIYTAGLHLTLWQQAVVIFDEAVPADVVTPPAEGEPPVPESGQPAAEKVTMKPAPEPEPSPVAVPLPPSDPALHQAPLTITGFQPAWMPFASETSASGFADRLSRQLGRDLHIQKTGPRKYEVGFHFRGAEERERVLDSIESSTGFRASNKS